MSLGFTNCSIDLVDDVCVVLVVVFNVVVVVVVFVEGVSKLFSFLEMNDLELVSLKLIQVFLQITQKCTPKATTQGDGNILNIRRNHGSDFETDLFMS